MREVVFHDNVLDLIDSEVASHEPERGGILLGPIGIPVVSEFIPDPEAAATSVTYSPSRQVGARVELATRGNIEVKGIVHSHPGVMDHPSSGDRNSFANWMGRMPWIPFLITPIVTVGANLRGTGQHKINLTHGEISVFIAEKRTNNQIALMEAVPRVLPLTRAIADIGDALGAVSSRTPITYVPVEGHPHASTTLSDRNGGTITVLIPYTFPLQAPLILVPSARHHRLQPSTDATAVPLIWDISVPEDGRLAQALRQYTAHSPLSVASMAPTVEPREASAAGTTSMAVRDGLRARLDKSLAPSVQDATVLVVGLGSGGSQTLEALARSSVEKFVVIDPDVVEAANLSRSVYDAEDIGASKCTAITRRIQAINPGAAVTSYEKRLNDLNPDELAELVDRVDYVVAATDDPDAQYRLNHIAWQRGKPAIFAGVYERGAAGEIVYTIPGATSCFRCATAGRRGGRRGTAVMNYGTGTLVAEPALGADITHVVSASVKLLLGLIELSDPNAHRNTAASLVASAAGAGRNFLQMSMVANYDYFPKIFDGVRGQHAYQSVWLETTSSPDCPTCGTEPTADRVHVPVKLGSLVPIEAVESTSNSGEAESPL
ncbi:ThiF family adenylyltransferase [Rhodococcoides fascians]|uniref:ThiF family adenylyltransferase n=1 Tax=Rhodococcoides fascians TaxID=1828 RepID=UPI002ACE3C13|nr:ThiF family adenylyltransferase [Rhodococcus fascians]WQH27572.1 ThiF family adenylyltransferase [Rhodococcus fascians]